VRGGAGPEGCGLESPWRSNLSQLPRSEVGWRFESLCGEACAGPEGWGVESRWRRNLGAGRGRKAEGWNGRGMGGAGPGAGRGRGVGGQTILLCRLGGRSTVAALTIASALVRDGLEREARGEGGGEDHKLEQLRAGRSVERAASSLAAALPMSFAKRVAARVPATRRWGRRQGHTVRTPLHRAENVPWRTHAAPRAVSSRQGSPEPEEQSGPV
jgi:hypothetical protein